MTTKYEECVICLDEMDDNQELYFFNNCIHIIHQKCFIKCKQVRPLLECPLCRKPILMTEKNNINLPHHSITIRDTNEVSYIVNNNIDRNNIERNNSSEINNINNNISDNNEIENNESSCHRDKYIKRQRFCMSITFIIAIIIFFIKRS